MYNNKCPSFIDKISTNAKQGKAAFRVNLKSVLDVLLLAQFSLRSKMAADPKLVEAAESKEEVDALEALAKEEKEFNKAWQCHQDSTLHIQLTSPGRRNRPYPEVVPARCLRRSGPSTWNSRLPNQSPISDSFPPNPSGQNPQPSCAYSLRPPQESLLDPSGREVSHAHRLLHRRRTLFTPP